MTPAAPAWERNRDLDGWFRLTVEGVGLDAGPKKTGGFAWCVSVAAGRIVVRHGDAPTLGAAQRAAERIAALYLAGPLGPAQGG